MLIIKFIMLLCLFIGLSCTLVPSLYGTVVIFTAAMIYAAIIEMSIFQTWVPVGLFMLTLAAELGARGLRIFLTRNYKASRAYSVNTIVCNVAGSIVADALLGSLVGMALWQGFVGRILFPRLDSISKVLLRLVLTAIVRYLCGLSMIVIVVKYIMYR